MLRFTLLTSMALLLLFSSCSSMPMIAKRGYVQVCGRVLAQTLSLLCQGQYCDPDEEVEEEENDVRRNIRPTDVNDREWHRVFPFHRTNGMDHRLSLRQSDRRRRGVVDECCKQSCTPEVLLSYCCTHK